MSLAATASGTDLGAFTTIPIIDLNRCDTEAGRLTTAHEIRDACMKVGFFYVRHHGIPQLCFDKVLTAMEGYFSLPMEVKMKLYHTMHSMRGYDAPLDSNIDSAHNSQGDFRECFRIGWEELETNVHDEKKPNGSSMTSANVWPSGDYPGFREACLEYYHAAAKVGRALFPLFALALELPETYFDDKTQNSAPFMRLLHYPLRDGYPEINDDTPGVGAHTDFEWFTILWQQPGIQALQAMNKEKKWIDAPPIEDALVVNIGDMLAVWTNDVFKSTVHRVVNKGSKERYSIPLFFGVDYDMNIEPIPSCVSAERPAKYGSVSAGEYVQKRLVDMYKKA